jgi:adenylate cyclase class 2
VIEQEIKLRFESVAAARDAVARLGAAPLRPRRLQDDVLLDSGPGRLREAGCALRLRNDGDSGVLTWKGPVIPAAVKAREEIESPIGAPKAAARILERLGFVPVFRYQKYREEYALDGLVAAIDETPIGVFVELEGGEAEIHRAAAALGRTRDDYIRASYLALYLEHCQRTGSTAPDMVFDAS